MKVGVMHVVAKGDHQAQLVEKNSVKAISRTIVRTNSMVLWPFSAVILV